MHTQVKDAITGCKPQETNKSVLSRWKAKGYNKGLTLAPGSICLRWLAEAVPWSTFPQPMNAVNKHPQTVLRLKG